MRRDIMPDFTQDDRDMLIKHDVKLENICSSIHKMDNRIDKNFTKLENIIVSQQKTCIEHREKIANQFFSKRVIMWAAGFIIAGIVGIGIYTTDLSTDVRVNEHKITSLEDRYRDNVTQQQPAGI
jgi:hypothetical protein